MDVNRLRKFKRCKALSLFTTLRINWFLLFKAGQPFRLTLSITMAGGLVMFREGEGKLIQNVVNGTDYKKQAKKDQWPFTFTPGNDASID